MNNAAAYGPGRPADVLGRSPERPEEWGLVGNRSDTAAYPDKTNVYSFKEPTSYSEDYKRRLAYCVLKNRSINTVTSMTKCPTPAR